MRRYGLHTIGAIQSLNRIVALAQDIFDCPIVVISLVSVLARVDCPLPLLLNFV